MRTGIAGSGLVRRLTSRRIWTLGTLAIGYAGRQVHQHSRVLLPGRAVAVTQETDRNKCTEDIALLQAAQLLWLNAALNSDLYKQTVQGTPFITAALGDYQSKKKLIKDNCNNKKTSRLISYCHLLLKNTFNCKTFC